MSLKNFFEWINKFDLMKFYDLKFIIILYSFFYFIFGSLFKIKELFSLFILLFIVFLSFN